jgi:hypothetical protein
MLVGAISISPCPMNRLLEGDIAAKFREIGLLWRIRNLKH